MTGFGGTNQNNGYPNTGYPNMDAIFNPGRMAQNTKPMTNRNFIIVTSLQEALGKEAPYNSKGIYVHQDGEYEFEIFTNADGVKSYEIFKRVKCTNEADAAAVPKNEFEELKLKIKKLEDVVYAKPNVTGNASTSSNSEM